MANPWKYIPASDYESHMASSSVGQSQVLNDIFKSRYQEFLPTSVAFFGICTGNGLEHIDPKITKTVYGIDVNSEYLKISSERYFNKGYTLELIEADINEKTVNFKPCDLIIADLFLEYVEIQKFINQIKLVSHMSSVISTIVQVNNTQTFVTETKYKSLEALAEFHHDINVESVIEQMKNNMFINLLIEKYPLPATKEFVRLDFQPAL